MKNYNASSREEIKSCDKSRDDLKNLEMSLNKMTDEYSLLQSD